MTDEVAAVETESGASHPGYTRAFVALASLFSVAAVASLVIAVSVPVDRGVNYFGRSAKELVGSHLPAASRSHLDVLVAKECVPSKRIRFSSPMPIRALGVCAAEWLSPDQPVTVLNSPQNARAFDRLSEALAQPDGVFACPAIAYLTQPFDISVLLGERWFAVDPPRTCWGNTAAVDKALSALKPPDPPDPNPAIRSAPSHGR